CKFDRFFLIDGDGNLSDDRRRIVYRIYRELKIVYRAHTTCTVTNSKGNRQVAVVIRCRCNNPASGPAGGVVGTGLCLDSETRGVIRILNDEMTDQYRKVRVFVDGNSSLVNNNGRIINGRDIHGKRYLRSVHVG